MSDLANCSVCGIKSTLKCGGCKAVVYCGKEHQKIHWRKVHKSECKCFELATDSTLGRYLRATKDIKQGEVILREAPIIYGPKISTFPICLGCNRLLEPSNKSYYRCTKCSWPLCGFKCESSVIHLDECKLMAEKHFVCSITPCDFPKKEAAYCVILPLRCLLKKKNNPALFKQIMILEDHLEQRLETPLYKILKSNLVTFVNNILGLTDIEETEILQIAAILDTNSYEIRQTEKKSKIRALFSQASMISHDCTPNTRHVFDEKNLNIIYVATVDIPKGSTISTSYTQPLKNTIQRREHLKLSKCFDCSCNRCKDATEFGTYTGAILCSKCKIGKIISTDPLENAAPWKCELCEHQISAKQINSGNNSIVKEIENLNKNSPKEFEEFLIKYQDTLHDKNSHVLQIKYALTQLYGNVPGFLIHELNDAAVNRKIDLCNALLEIADKFDPGWSLFRGMILLDLQEILAVETKREYLNSLITKEAAQEKLMESMVILKEAVEILKIQPGMEFILQDRVKNLTRTIEMED